MVCLFCFISCTFFSHYFILLISLCLIYFLFLQLLQCLYHYFQLRIFCGRVLCAWRQKNCIIKTKDAEQKTINSVGYNNRMEIKTVKDTLKWDIWQGRRAVTMRSFLTCTVVSETSIMGMASQKCQHSSRVAFMRRKCQHFFFFFFFSFFFFSLSFFFSQIHSTQLSFQSHPETLSIQ